uniref:Uncharacterized protein n=1 Tax=Alexandrium monilatum TaxID=311494 RepID=A0A7S4R5T5_9DINO
MLAARLSTRMPAKRLDRLPLAQLHRCSDTGACQNVHNKQRIADVEIAGSISAKRPLVSDPSSPADDMKASQLAGIVQAGKPVLVLGAASPQMLSALGRMGLPFEHRVHECRPR